MTIATDNVDNEMVEYPRRWDIKAIRKFMMTFGLLSSVFDYLTFGLLLLVFHATQDQFRTGWFLESVCSASLIVLVIRSRKPFFRSRPSEATARRFWFVRVNSCRSDGLSGFVGRLIRSRIRREVQEGVLAYLAEIKKKLEQEAR